MTEEKFIKYKNQYSSNNELIDFWTNIKLGYDKFAKDKTELIISISKTGDYIFKWIEEFIEDYTKSINDAIIKLEGIKSTLQTDQSKKEIIQVCRILKQALEEL